MLPPPFPWCTTITGYHTSSDNSNSQQQPTAGYRQTSKLLPGVSQSRRVKSTTNGICTWRFKYANTIPTVLCVNNGIICGYITGIHDKRTVTSWVNLLQFFGIIRLLSSILSADCLW